MTPDVLFALAGDVRRNARAMRQLAALAGMGLRVRALGLGPPAVPGDLPEGVAFWPLGVPETGGPRFFLAYDRALRRAVRGVGARVFHASDLYGLPALAAAARRQGARLAFDSRELYPDTPAVAHRPLVRTVWRLVERVFVRRADAVLTVADGLADVLAARYRIARPTVVVNAPPAHDGPAADLRGHAGLAPGTPVVLHTGALRAGRGLAPLVRAMASVDATLVLLGDGPLAPSLERLAAHVGARVRVAPPVPPGRVPAYAAAADVGAVFLDDTCLNLRLALPNKLLEYVAGGLPVVAADLPGLRSVVAAYGVGLVVPPRDVGALAAALRRALTDDALRARVRANLPAARRAFSAETADTRFRTVYRSFL